MQRAAFIFVFLLIAALSSESFAIDTHAAPIIETESATKDAPTDYSALPEAAFPPPHPT
jgi:hypothetical protein